MGVVPWYLPLRFGRVAEQSPVGFFRGAHSPLELQISLKNLISVNSTFGTHVQIHMGMDTRQTNCPSRHKRGTWGVLEGQQFKSIGKLSDWHQLWFTSADSSGNGHRLNTSRPSIPHGVFRRGGLGCHKLKSSGKLSNGWTDWHQIWHTSADPSGN